MTIGLASVASCARVAYGVGCTYSDGASAVRGLGLGICIPFVDPSLPACEAPLCWYACAAAPILDAVAERAIAATSADLSLHSLTSAARVAFGQGGEELVILRDSSAAVTLRCRGSRAAKGPVDLTLVNRLSAPDEYASAAASLSELLLRPTKEVEYTRGRLLLRDALIAIDGKCLGATYREIATVIYGSERVLAEWGGASRWMKDHICRAYAKGEQLRDGGFRELLQLRCRFI